MVTKKLRYLTIVSIGAFLASGYFFWFKRQDTDLNQSNISLEKTVDQSSVISVGPPRATQTAPRLAQPNAATSIPAGSSVLTLTDLRTLNIADLMNEIDGDVAQKLHTAMNLGGNHQLSIDRSKNDRMGNTHTRINQTYLGLPLWGKSISVHESPQQSVYRLSGEMLQGELSDDLAQFVKQMDASESSLKEKLKIAQDRAGFKASSWKLSDEEVQAVLYFNETTETLMPVYAITWYASPRERDVVSGVDIDGVRSTEPYVLLDAQTLEIVKQWESMSSAQATGPGGNGRIGDRYYGIDQPALEVQQMGNTCYLQTPEYRTVNHNHKEQYVHEPFSFECSENTYKKINGGNSPLNDLHHYAQYFFDAFDDWYGGNPLPFQLTQGAHFGINVNNAFGGGRYTKFGDGGNNDYPTTTLDVIAHEIGHVITSLSDNSKLVDVGQAGSLNEAFSDMTGATVYYYHTGLPPWNFGAEHHRAINEVSRYLDVPSRKPPSIDHVDNYYDGIGNHYGAGIYDRAFYLLASSKGWSIRQAYEVFYEANKHHWSSTETFVGGACGVLEATDDLGYPALDVIQAFVNVGVICPTFIVVDNDNDNMEDSWEARMGLDPTVNDAANDNDGDGLTNVQEYSIRSHPRMADSDSDGLSDATEYAIGTNPNLRDSDLDGLSDQREVEVELTDPRIADTDVDGQPDGWELQHGFNPHVPDGSGDFDGDGLSNADEFRWCTDPTQADSDGDGLLDGEEVNTHLTSPRIVDTDSDDLEDGLEIDIGTNPLHPDPDNDGLVDSKEIEWNTDPFDSDSDDDGLLDGNEVLVYESDPLSADTDGDGMPDGWEAPYIFGGIQIKVNDANVDLDQDGLTNIQEYNNKTAPIFADTDMDRVADNIELTWGFNPILTGDVWRDDDGDGWSTEQELRYGSHPFSATSSQGGLPPKPSVPATENLLPFALEHCTEEYDGNYYPCRRSIDVVTGWNDEKEHRSLLHFAPTLWPVQSALLQYRVDEVNTDVFGETFRLVGLMEGIVRYTSDEAIWQATQTAPALTYREHGVDDIGQLFVLPLEANFVSYVNSFNGNLFFATRLTSIALRGEFIEDIIFPDDNLQLTVTYGPDINNNGLPDIWESSYGLSDPLGDPDNDGAVNLQEAFNKTDPTNPDTDGDGLLDGAEIFSGLDPDRADGHLDNDGDGLKNSDEIFYGLSPVNRDSNLDGVADNIAVKTDSDNDGIPDVWELRFAFDPDDPEDAYRDSDNDGWMNHQEFTLRTHPRLNGGSAEGMSGTPVRSPGVDTIVLNRAWTCSVGASTTCAEDTDNSYSVGHSGSSNEDKRMAIGLNRLTRFWHVQTVAFDARLELASDEDETLTISAVNTVFEGDIVDSLAAWSDLGSGSIYGEIFVTGIGNYSANLSVAMKDKFNWEPGHFDMGMATNLLDGDPFDEKIYFSYSIEIPRIHVVYANDSDNDNLTDDWELLHGVGNAFGDNDNDNDGAINLQEYIHRIDPNDNDTDNDGMPDGWELSYGLKAYANDAAEDQDGDTLTNLQEFQRGTSPLKVDTDGDGIPDPQDNSNPGPGALPSTINVFNDWGSGYCAEVKVTNNTAQPVDWTTVFTVNDQITQSWEMIYSKTGNQVTAQGVTWNNVLQPFSQSHSIGFCANRNQNSGSYPIRVRARGTSGQEVINLTVGGQIVGTWTLTTSYQDYSVTTSLGGGINVVFTNDAANRDVRVDYVSINNVIHQAENQSNNTGAWNGSCGAGAYSEWLHCNGYIGFSAYK